jgi:hypothetical protein
LALFSCRKKRGWLREKKKTRTGLPFCREYGVKSLMYDLRFSFVIGFAFSNSSLIRVPFAFNLHTESRAKDLGYST